MDFIVLLDKLDDLVQNSGTFPLTDKVMIDRQEIYGLMEQMRSTIPEEIRQSRWIVKERKKMLEEASEESERLASQEEIVKRAERESEEMLRKSEARSREIRLGAEDYADEVLGKLENNLEKFLAAVQRGRERLQTGSDTGE